MSDYDDAYYLATYGFCVAKLVRNPTDWDNGVYAPYRNQVKGTMAERIGEILEKQGYLVLMGRAEIESSRKEGGIWKVKDEAVLQAYIILCCV